MCWTIVLSRGSFWEQKLLLGALDYQSICLQGTTASLAWWVSLAGFAANASIPVEAFDPTVLFWTNISLEHGGGLSSLGDFVLRSWTSDPSTNLFETRAS